MTEPSILDLADGLRAAGAGALDEVGADGLRRAFDGAVDAFRDPGSAERRRLDPELRQATGMSQPCLDGSLEALLAGFSSAEVSAMVERGRSFASVRSVTSGERAPAGALPHLLVLAAGVPGLLLQPLLATLAVLRPALIKPASREPFFARAFAAALVAREPRLRKAIGIAAWRGGSSAIEERLWPRVGRIVAYAGAEAIADLRQRAGAKLIAFGPKTSIALVGGLARSELAPTAAALARDAVLFEQRGCLSLQSVYVDSDPDALAGALAGALERAADRWPPPPLPAEEAAAVRLAREEAAFLGCAVPATALARGTVIVDPRPDLVPSPGRRTVRIHPVPDLDSVLDLLRRHRGLVQGAALAGARARCLDERLLGAGVSYVCAPGELQSPPATWANGGIDLVTALAGDEEPATGRGSSPARLRGSPTRRR